MSKKQPLRIALISVVLALVAISIWLGIELLTRKSTLARLLDPNDDVKIIGIRFEGQQRIVRIQDPLLLDKFTVAFKHPTEHQIQAGLNYHVDIKLSSG